MSHNLSHLMTTVFRTKIAGPRLVISDVSESFDFEANSHSFFVNSNLTWSWSSDVAWITSDEDTPQTGSQTFSYSVTENISTQRTGTITFTSGDITRTHTVTQGPYPILTIDDADHTFDSDADSLTFNVTSNTDWTWFASEDWVTSSEAVFQNGNQAFTYSVTANTGAERTATITFVDVQAGVVEAVHSITQSAEATLLDTYTGAVGFSLRKIRTAYTGDCIRVRRASDDAEQDIGFSGNDLDTAAIETFCSGTTGYVTTWYDQVGSNNATQTTGSIQPIIYESGAVVVNEHGLPAIRFLDDDINVVAPRLSFSPWAIVDAPWFGQSMVYSLQSAGDFPAIVFGAPLRSQHVGTSLESRLTVNRTGGSSQILGSAFDLNTTTVRMDTADRSTIAIWLNTDLTPDVTGADRDEDSIVETISIGNRSLNSIVCDTLISEIICFNDDESANNLAIRTNQSAYWKPVAAPLITVQPEDNVDLTVGDTLSLSVTATGAGLSYQWVKGSEDITGETSATLEIVDAQESDSGTYYVVVSNSEGSVNSEESLVTVTAAPVAPTITVQPSASVSLEVGDTLTLTVTATGDSPLSYQWRVGGVNIPGETSPTLQNVNVQESDAGTYSVVVTNPAGSATSNNSVVSVSVPTPVAPTITVQPQASVSLTVGDTLNLSVTATGTAPLSYQWKVGGVDITGETASTLEILNMQEADAGTYTVAVTNSAGTATSNNSVVSVSVPVPNSVYQRPDGSDIFQPDGTSQYVRP